LTLTVSSKRSEILRALEPGRFTRQAYLTLEVTGLPEVGTLSLFAWPEPAGRPVRIGVDIVRINTALLPYSLTAGFELTAEERSAVPAVLADDRAGQLTALDLKHDLEDARPETILIGSTEWTLCPQGRIEREVRKLDDNGRPIFHEVDVGIYCYRLVCARCGRARYARRNSIHQIQYCRVCTAQDQYRRRALNQYLQRARRVVARRRLPPEVVARLAQLHKAGALGIDIAAELRISPGCVSKYLKKLGLR